ncbi:MAG: uroporphyrinogen decarboxylase [Chthoniobacterales bacterium]|nr:uroporphyrinogen decarboxylase [Chthoniobacterales bacterium]
MNGRERFLAACRCQPVDRPPVWMMRQAGRYLPEYRALKEGNSFLEMIRSPELATEVTMQPLARFPFDAAIIFSDILVVPEALGQPFSFREGSGVQMEFALRAEADLARLSAEGASQKLAYVNDALRETRSVLGEDRALIGFCGSPWTLAAYMVEGGSSADGRTIRDMAARRDPALHKLLSLLTGVLAEYLRGQIAAGADAVQIFDSWASWCEDYEEWSLRWVRELIAALPAGFPVVFFARGRNRQAAALASTGATVLSLDGETPLSTVRRALGDGAPALQGNMDPSVLEGEPSAAAAAAREVLTDMAPFRGHIFNLGHGIRPTARTECVGAVVEAVLQFRHDPHALAAG